MYTIDDFKTLGLYEEKAAEEDHEFVSGKVISNLPSKIQYALANSGGSTHGSNKSSQDASVITLMLRHGLSADDCYATFMQSPRGRDAVTRKNGHSEDYLSRTIRRAMSFVSENPNPVSSKLQVNFANRRTDEVGTGIIISKAHEVETEKVNWLWPGFIPAGRLTLLAGDPSMGKSTIVADIISRMSKGKLMPSGVRGITGSSLVASAEDAPEDTIVPRLIASDADLKRVGIIREVREEQEVGENSTRYLSFPRDLNLLRETLTNQSCRLLIIDPLNAFIERGVDTYKDQDIRSILHPLEMIAQETGTAIVIVAHLNKKEDASTLYRIGGSIGFIGAARSVLAVTRQDDLRILFSLKSNLCRRPTSLSYEIRDTKKVKSTKNTWKGEDTIHSSSIRWLGEVDFDPFVKKAEASPTGASEEEARSFLRSLLSEGAVEVDTIYDQAKQAGITKTVINRVRASVDVTAVRRSGNWFWQINQTES